MASVIPVLCAVIGSFAEKATEAVFNGLTNKEARKFEAVARVARRKPDMVHAASTLSDLKAPPANQLTDYN
jgi:plasmid maintenance system killer protein